MLNNLGTLDGHPVLTCAQPLIRFLYDLNDKLAV